MRRPRRPTQVQVQVQVQVDDGMVDDGTRLTLEDVKAAAAVGRLGDISRQMVAEGHWFALDVLLEHAGHRDVPLEALVEGARAVVDGVAALGEGRRMAAAEEILAIKRRLGRALARRTGPIVTTAVERQAALLAASLSLELGNLRNAAELFERAGDDVQAADAYGALGDLENMERCLARDEARRAHRREITEAVRTSEVLAATGDRWAAVQVAAALTGEGGDVVALRAKARELDRRLCRGRAVSFRLADGRILRLCAAPALLGRDAAAELPLRDPTVSRRHATIARVSGAFVLADAGSRGGTRIAKVPIGAPVPLAGEGEIGLGDHCQVRFRAASDELLELQGASGLDRTLWAVIGSSPVVPLGPALPAADGLTALFSGPVIRLQRAAEARVRVDGRLAGLTIDLLHGDRIELEAGLTLEVL
jgi:hypothetical protein